MGSWRGEKEMQNAFSQKLPKAAGNKEVCWF